MSGDRFVVRFARIVAKEAKIHDAIRRQDNDTKLRTDSKTEKLKQEVTDKNQNGSFGFRTGNCNRKKSSGLQQSVHFSFTL